MTQRLVIATTNPHKVEEFRALLAGAPFSFVGLAELGVTHDVPETGATFEENAIIKARAYAEITGLLTLADDSGLEIDALDGAPGIYSARWAGPDVPYETRNRMLVDRLSGLPDERRGARYQCVIAIAAPPPRGLIGVAEGVFEGRIAREPAGSGGFGYDPIFYVPAQGRTVGQMTAAEKHAISHRALAARAALPMLERLASDDQASH
ncbi:MAG: RdgB/HAM1 family non-canonical purine NTP pyrophosphatase [Ktedonobacterales bacterium]